MTTRIGGRKTYKGERELLGTRAPKRLADAARTKAEELGLSVSDYLATVLAEDLGLHQYVPAQRAKDQMELPIDQVA